MAKGGLRTDGPDFERKRLLHRSGRPATRFADGRERVAVEGRKAVLAKCLPMVWRGITLMPIQTILLVDGVPFFPAGLPRGSGHGKCHPQKKPPPGNPL